MWNLVVKYGLIVPLASKGMFATSMYIIILCMISMNFSVDM